MKTLLFACILPLALFPITEVPDTASLPFLNPDLKQTQTTKIQLDNGLSVFLISDPKADLSAATMSVQSGSWSDPVEYPGMAHFCEHMLFMGSEKYPDENAFSSLIANYGGMTNAFTADDKTVYMFSSRKEGFQSLLDHFARFFIDPLFHTSSISRELNAVDQEFAKNIQNDLWRIHMIGKETGNPNHPNRMFSIGNSETLSHIPQSALKKWHAEHYGANRMTLAIYSSMNIDELKKSVEEMFSAVPAAHPAPLDTTQTLLSSNQKGHITYISPFKDLNAIMLRWELPFDLANEPSHPAQTLAFSLARAQNNNLEQLLKNEKWVDRISIAADGRAQHRFFTITLYPTQKGMKERDQLIQRCFQAVAGMQEGLPSHLFEERNALAKLHYQYQSRIDAFTYIQSIGEAISDEPLASFPRAQLMGSEYSPTKINQVLSVLKPQDCAITIVGSPAQTGVIPDQKERWMGAQYVIRPISPDSLALWTDVPPHESIHIASPNPFIPTHLALVEESEASRSPLLIAENEFGTAYFARCPEFLSPEVAHIIHLLTPALTADPKSQVLAALYLDHLTDQINPLLDAASSAGMQTSFSIEQSQIQIQLSGFSDKSSQLLTEIIRNLTQHPPTPEQFALYYERHEKFLANANKELAFRQAKELLNSLLWADKPTSKARLAALRNLTHEDFSQFCKKIFDQVYIQAVFAGNLTQKDATSSWIDILHALAKKPYPKNSHRKPSPLQLNGTKGPYRIAESVPVIGNSSLLLIDEGPFTFTKRATQEILSSAIKEAFFQELRTKQKTGYVASSDAQEIEKRLYQFFLVQSNSHQPEDLLYRFELFLETYLHNLEQEITQDRFQTLRASAIDSLQTRFRNLRTKAALWDFLAFQYNGDFDFIDKRIKALQELDYPSFTMTAKTFLSRENKKRLALLFEGKNPAFSYHPVTLEEISAIVESKTHPDLVEN